MKTLFFYNPYSGNHRFYSSASMVSKVTQLLSEMGFDSIATSTLPTTFDGYQLVIVMGGDGTINRVIQTIPPTLPLGIIPFGTANVLAKSLSIPTGLKEALTVIKQGKTKHIDLGQIGTHRFCCMAGFGFDVDTIRFTDRYLKKYFGKLGYLIAGIYTLICYNPQCITITDQDSHEQAFGYFSIVANIPFYAGAYLVSKDCKNDDGFLDVFLLTSPTRWALLKAFFYLFFLSLDRCKDIKKMKLKMGTVSNSPPFHVDAEVIEIGAKTISILPHALTIICP